MALRPGDGMVEESSLPPLDVLMEHRQPMRVIDRLLSVESGGMTALGVVGADSLFAGSDGRVAREVFPEMVAQTFAAGAAVYGEHPSRGFLAAIKRARFFGDAYVGDELRASAVPLGQVGDIIVVDGDVRAGDAVLATVSLKIFLIS